MKVIIQYFDDCPNKIINRVYEVEDAEKHFIILYYTRDYECNHVMNTCSIQKNSAILSIEDEAVE